MARRKSLNRRLSRYSRNSTRSAFLDPDTENFGDEQPYWWKNLENNTVMRPSMSFNTANETSTILDPNSRIDSGELQDGWWKVLETTAIADDATLTMPIRKPDADSNTVTTLESDEEPRIMKRKVTLRSAARKSRGNPFVNISESGTSDEKSTGSSPMNKSGSIDATSSKRANKISESSSGQSHSTDVVLKLKPTLFKRRHKDRQRNVFDDVLKENQLLTPSKRKSLKLSSHSKTGTLMENKILAITESPIVKQGGSRQLVLSFENDHDLSRLPNPEAQSTLLESSSSTQGSNKDSNNSEMEARVLKPKSTFLKHRKRGADKNVFADIFAEEETHNDVEISKWKEKGIDTNAEALKTCSVRQADGSFRVSQSTPSNVVNESSRTGDAKATKGSRSTEAISPSAQNPRGSLEPNALAQASIASSDTSDKSQDHKIFLKPRSTFLKRSRKRRERNIFQEILEEEDNVDALRRSRSDTLIDRTKDVMMKNQATVAHETGTREIIDQDSNTALEELHLELAGSSEEDIASPDGNNAKETSEMYKSIYSDIDVSALGSEPKEKRQRRSALHVSPEISEMSNRRTASPPRIINEVSKSGGGGTWNSDIDVSVASKHEEGNHTKSQSPNQHERDVLEENKGSSHKLHTQLSIDTLANFDQESKVIERTRRNDTNKLGKLSFRTTINDSESDDLQSSPSRPSKKLRTSIRQSTVVTCRDTDLEPVLSTPKRQSKSSRVIDEAEVEEVQAASKRQSRNSNMSQKVLNSRVFSEDEEEEVQATSKRQSRNSSRPQKLLSSRVLSEDEEEEVQATSKRQSRNSSMSQKLLRSHVISEDEAEDVRATPKRQSRNSSRPQNLFSSRVISEDEADEVEATSKRQTRNSSRSQKLLSSRVLSEDEAEDVQATPKTQSNNSSISQKLLSSRVMSESEAVDVQATLKSQSNNSSISQKLLSSRVMSESEAVDVQATLKSQSRNSSMSQKLLRSHVMSESEAEDVQAIPKSQSRNSSRPQKLLSSRGTSGAEVEEVQATSKRQTRNSNRSQKLLSSRVMSESEAEDVQATPKSQSRNSSRPQKLLSSRGTSGAEVEEVQATSKRQTRNSSRSQKLLSSRVMSESEAEDVQATPKSQSRNSSRPQKLLSSRALSEDEEEEVQATSKRQTRNSSRSQKLLSSRVLSEDEAEDVQATPKSQSRNSSRPQKLLSSRGTSGAKVEEVQATSKRQTRNSSRSQKLLSSRVMSESEAEDVQATPKSQSRNSSRPQKLLSSRALSEDEAEDVQATPKSQSRNSSRPQKLLSSRVLSEDEEEEVQATSKRQSRNSSRSQELLSSRVISEDEADEVQSSPKSHSKVIERTRRNDTSKLGKLSFRTTVDDSESDDLQSTPSRPSKKLRTSIRQSAVVTYRDSDLDPVLSTPKRQSKSLSKSEKLSSSRVISADEAEDVEATPKSQSRNSSGSQKLLSSRVLSEVEEKEVQATPKPQSRNSSMSQKLLRSRVVSECEAEDIQSTRKTRESKSVDKAQKRSTLIAINEFEAEDPNTPERQSKVLSMLPNDISSVANQIQLCEIDGRAKGQRKSMSRVEKQLTEPIVNLSETKEVEISQQTPSRNLISREPSVSPARGESELTVAIASESNTHRVQEEEEEESFSATRRSEQRIAFNPNIPKDREDADLLNASSKNAKEAKEVSRNDTGRDVGTNRSVSLGKAKGSAGSTITSTNPGKDSSRSQRNIEEFLIPASQVFTDKEKMEKLTRKLENIKKQTMDDMKLSANSCKGKLPLQQKKPSNLVKTAKTTQKQRPAKPIDKAFLINGEVYKVPRLPRPKYWVTDRLYKYLWKQLEPKYTLQTRVISEKFVKELSNVTSFIVKQKSYTSYRAELYALMKEMARLGIISTRFEFYNFCREFFPYALRIKVVPMLLPGNKSNIPYEKDELNEPLLRS